MGCYVFSRFAQALVVIVIVSIIVFLIMYLVPGDAVTVLAGPDPTPEVVEALRVMLGLDQPLPVRYGKWAFAAMQGDLGTSPIIGRPVSELIWSRLPATLELAVAAILIASVFGILVGVVAAQRHGTWVDATITAINSFVLSVPNFWFGILGILCFAVWLDWLPSGGRKLWSDGPRHAFGWTSSSGKIEIPAFGKVAKRSKNAVRRTNSGFLLREAHQSRIRRICCCGAARLLLDAEVNAVSSTPILGLCYIIT